MRPGLATLAILLLCLLGSLPAHALSDLSQEQWAEVEKQGKLEETRQAQFPAFDDVKGQIIQRMQQQKVAEFQEELRTKAKTDYKFSAN